MRRLEAVYFPADDGVEEWRRLAAVLEATAAAHCPAWSRRVVRIGKAKAGTGTGVSAHVANTHKLEHWADLVAASADGDELLLLDADTYIRQPLDEVWSRPFDLAYTVREYPVPFNLGVLFVRVSDRARALFELLRAENRRLFRPSDETAIWRRRFGGVNQAAFGFLLERGVYAGCTIRQLPCHEWNCEVSSWPRFDPAVTRIVHVNGALRRQIFHREPRPDVALEPIVHEWRALDRGERRQASA